MIAAINGIIEKYWYRRQTACTVCVLTYIFKIRNLLKMKWNAFLSKEFNLQKDPFP